MEIANEISKIRASLGMTRRELSIRLNVTEGTIYNWEVGKSEPPASVMDALREWVQEVPHDN